MKIVVLGGTGVAGRATVAAALARGWSVVVASRSGGAPEGADGCEVDAATGTGLAEAFAGADVVVDATNALRTRRGAAVRTFTAMAGHVQDTAARSGVGRIVVLSIVGIDDVPYAYYEAKLAQERAYRAGAVPVVVQRTTQFFEFADQMLAFGRRGPLALVPVMRSQPVAVADVGEALCDAASEALPGDGFAPELAGMEVLMVPDMVRRLVRARGESVRVLPVRVPGRAGVLMAKGSLIPAQPRLAPTTFDAWLAGQSYRATGGDGAVLDG